MQLPSTYETFEIRSLLHGWRRKAAFATLMMALALLAGWMRSLVVFDVLRYSSGEFQFIVHSDAGHIDCFRRTYYSLGDGFDGTFGYDSGTFNVGFLRALSELPDENRWDFAGFAAGAATITYPIPSTVKIEGFAIPHWALVLPMTLLSAWLLLGKLRQKKATAVAAPDNSEPNSGLTSFGGPE